MNVGTGVETSVVELFRTIRDLSGSSAPERHAEAKPGEQRRSVLGYDLAASELEWKPEVSLQDGLKTTVDWFRERVEQPASNS